MVHLVHEYYKKKSGVSASLVGVWNRFIGGKQQRVRIQDWTAQPQKEMAKGGYGRGVQNHDVHEWVKKASLVCPLCQ